MWKRQEGFSLVKAEHCWQEGRKIQKYKGRGSLLGEILRVWRRERGRKKRFLWMASICERHRENNEGKKETFKEVWLCIITIYSWPLLVGE